MFSKVKLFGANRNYKILFYISEWSKTVIDILVVTPLQFGSDLYPILMKCTGLVRGLAPPILICNYITKSVFTNGVQYVYKKSCRKNKVDKSILFGKGTLQ